MKIMNVYSSIRQETWIIPILLAIFSFVGLIGALVFDGIVDNFYVLLLAMSAFAIFLPWLKLNVT